MTNPDPARAVANDQLPRHDTPDPIFAESCEEEGIARDAPSRQVPSGKLSRHQAVKLTGYSVTQLRRFEQQGLLHAKRVGRSGKRLYDGAEVEALRQRRRAGASREALDGALAAEVFAMLDDGANQVDVVRRLHVHPVHVEDLYQRWARLRDARTVAAEHARAIESHAARIGEEIHWDERLVQLFGRLVEHEVEAIADALVRARAAARRAKRASKPNSNEAGAPQAGPQEQSP